MRRAVSASDASRRRIPARGRTSFVARLLPGLALPTIVTAALGSVRYWVFAASVSAAATLWNALLYFTGGALTRASEYVSAQTGIAREWSIVAGVAAVVVGATLWFTVSRLRRRRRTASPFVGRVTASVPFPVPHSPLGAQTPACGR